jgi:peptidoglycan/xylan/chitin deacetylase (PgdA/CDA1 family)
VRASFILSSLIVWATAHAQTDGGPPPPAPAAAPVPAAAKPAKPKIFGPPGTGPEILLTFDDGPATMYTPKVLDILDERGIKAVFFVNGWHFMGKKASDEKAREVLRETARRGHAIGNHTIHHYFLCGKVYSKRTAEEIEGNATLIQEAIGIRPDLFRTPFGAHCKQLTDTLAGLGVKHTGWDIDPQDWKLRNAAKIEAYIASAIKRLKGRAILLLHDVHAETLKALPNILDSIDKENEARAKKGEPQIRIIDYSYLVPEHKIVPPALDALGRVLVECLSRVRTATYWRWLAWLPGQV